MFYIELALGLEFSRISKLDIAADFDFDFQRPLIRTLKDRTYDLIINNDVADPKHVVGLDAHSYDVNLERIFAHPQVTVHNKSRELSLKVYNKRQEIKDASKKQYITQYVGYNGAHYRFEVGCRGVKGLFPSLVALGIDDETLYIHLEDEDFLSVLYMNLLHRLIHLRKGRKKISIIKGVLNTMKSRLSVIKRRNQTLLVNRFGLQRRKIKFGAAVTQHMVFSPLGNNMDSESFQPYFLPY